MGEALITRRGGGGSVELKQVASIGDYPYWYSGPDYNNYDYLVVGQRSHSDGSDPMQVVWGCNIMALVTGVGQISGTYTDEGSSTKYVSALTGEININGYVNDSGPVAIIRVYPKGSLEIATE